MSERSRLKRMIGGVYSRAAERVYEPLIVRGTFKLAGGRLNDLVLEQGRRATRSAAGRPILDMPVGTGYFTIPMAKRHDGVVIASDLAAGMVAKARADAGAAGADDLLVVRADAHHLPFADGAFGAVVCSNGLQVIPGTEQTLSELVRVLADDGTLYLSIVGLPIARVLPASAATKLPAIFRSGRDFVDALARLGMSAWVTRSRLACLLEAKRAGAGS